MNRKVRGQTVYSPAERIERRSIKDDVTGCWNWSGAILSEAKPYGRMTIGSRADGTRRTIGAHRYSYETFVGPITNGMAICHHCDNPRCVNPAHLFEGTWKDNADDRDRKGRNKLPKILYGADAPWARFSAAEVADIRSSKESSRVIAARLGVDDSHIRSLRRGNHYPSSPFEPREDQQ